MAATPAITPRRDVQVETFTDAFSITRRSFDAAIITDDPGIADGTREVYSTPTEVKQDFHEETPVSTAIDQLFSQEFPKPDLIYIIKLASTSAPTDWSTGLNDITDKHGLFFYHLAATTREPAERAEIASWAKSHEVIYHTANYPGDRALAELDPNGVGATQLEVKAREYGEIGNDYSVELLNTGADAALSVEVIAQDPGWKLEVTLATDTGGAVTSTWQEIADEINQTAKPSALFIAAAVGTPSNTAAAAPETDLANGGSNFETLTDLGTAAAEQNHPRVKYYKTPDGWSQQYWYDMVAVGESAPLSPGSFWLHHLKTVGVPEATNEQVFGADAHDATDEKDLRDQNLNSLRFNRIGFVVWSDDLASDGQPGDLQQKVDRINTDLRVAMTEALSNPPAIHYGGLPYDPEGIGVIEDELEDVMIANAQRNRRVIARGQDGQVLARIDAPTFREVAGGDDHQNRIYHSNLTWEATILLFIGQIRVRGHLTTEFIAPRSAAFFPEDDSVAAQQ